MSILHIPTELSHRKFLFVDDDCEDVWCYLWDLGGTLNETTRKHSSQVRLRNIQDIAWSTTINIKFGIQVNSDCSSLVSFSKC